MSEAEALLAALDGHAAAGRGAFVGPDGRMVDAATVRSAERIVAIAERFGVAEDDQKEAR